jgi:predicted PurR-regulated permease PerM
MSEKPSKPATVNPANVPVRAEWARLRLWQIQFVRDVAALFIGIGVLWLGYELSVVTVPLLLAVFLAYLLEPIVKRATHGGRVTRQGVAGGIIAVVAVGVVVPLVLGLAVAVVQGVQYTAVIGQNVRLLVQSAVDEPLNKEKRAALEAKGPLWVKVRDYVVTQEEKYQYAKHDEETPAESRSKAPVEPLPPGTNPPLITPPGPEEPSAIYSLFRAGLKWTEEHAGELSGKVLQGSTGVASVIAGFAAGTAGRVGGLAFGTFLTFFFFFFVCTGWGRVLRFWQSLIPERKQGRVFALVEKMDGVIAGFVRGRMTICAILMVFYTIGYWMIGVPAWLLMGPLMGVLVLVPYAQGVGAPAAMLLMALQPASGFQGQWWWIIAAPLVLLTIGQFLDDYILTPRIQGKSTNMDTPTILFASIAGGTLAGIYGLLVAIPVAACLKILLKEVFWPRFKAWAEGRERDFLPLER